MRTAFFASLLEMAEQDSRVFLTVGDLGFSVIEPFLARFPDRFLNTGIAEQNMTGVAAGLALSGKVVFTYSIANFPTLRCLEQIRNDVCYHNADVKIVAVGGGFSYGSLGMSHHATEDIAIMRALPRMTVVAPGDPLEAFGAVRALVNTPGPAYLRLGKTGEAKLHGPDFRFELGKAFQLRDGGDATLVATGGMLQTAIDVAEQLDRRGIRVRVLSMPTIKPLDVDAILCAARETAALVTLEEHSIIGGLGSAVAETLMDEGAGAIPLKRLGLPSAFASRAGSQEYLRAVNGLSEDAICATVEAFLSARVAPSAADFVAA